MQCLYVAGKMTKCLLMRGVHLWEVCVSGGLTVVLLAKQISSYMLIKILARRVSGCPVDAQSWEKMMENSQEMFCHTVTLASARTQTTRSGVQHANHQAIASPTTKQITMVTNKLKKHVRTSFLLESLSLSVDAGNLSFQRAIHFPHFIDLVLE